MQPSLELSQELSILIVDFGLLIVTTWIVGNLLSSSPLHGIKRRLNRVFGRRFRLGLVFRHAQLYHGSRSTVGFKLYQYPKIGTGKVSIE